MLYISSVKMFASLTNVNGYIGKAVHKNKLFTQTVCF